MDKRPGSECGVRIAGSGKLHRLSNGRSQNQFRFNRRPQPGPFQCLFRQPAKWSMGWVRYRHPFHLRLRQIF